MAAATKPAKAYTLAEIAKHNTLHDAWVTCGGYVHDITSFMSSHPGGADYLMPHLGGDCEAAMQEHDHSAFSYNLLKTFCIGTVAGQAQRQHCEIDASHLRGYTAAQLDAAMDFDKPVLQQVLAMGDKYWPWLVSRPVCRDNKMRIFVSGALEALSHWPWWYIWVLWPPVVAYNVYCGAVAVPADAAAARVPTTVSADGVAAVVGTSFALGALFWTLLEYLMHRFVFHHETFNAAGNVFHYFMHGVHHLVPTDTTRLTFPPLLASALAALFWLMFRGAFSVATSAALLAPGAASHHSFFAGFMITYVMYDTLHFFFHHTDFDNALFRRLKTAHMNHHYKNEFANFGVTSPLWDFVFGTYDVEAGAHSKAQ
jgi:4-hydroxysphinganine ceramide fatty acyl 2-hydroxylase